MVKARKVSAEFLDSPKRTVKTLTPAQLKREAMDAQLRGILNRLSSVDDAFMLELEAGEKAATVRLRVLKVAAEMKVQIVVRTGGEDALLVGLLTPGRQSNRGRRKVAVVQ